MHYEHTYHHTIQGDEESNCLYKYLLVTSVSMNVKRKIDLSTVVAGWETGYSFTCFSEQLFGCTTIGRRCNMSLIQRVSKSIPFDTTSLNFSTH